MKLLIDDIRLTSGNSDTQAELAIGAILEFISTQLPFRVMGRIRETQGSRIGRFKTKAGAGQLGISLLTSLSKRFEKEC